MPIEVLMPALSPTMTEGTLAKWVKKEGDAVASGDVIAEIETDKATMEVEAVDEGVMGKILINEGTEGVAVNTLIALLLAEGEDKSAVANYAASGAAPAAKAQTPADPTAKTDAPVATVASTASGERIFASPLAKRIAGQEGVDISKVTGTGPHGRIIKADIQDALKNGVSKAAMTSNVAHVSVGRNPQEYTEIPNSGMRKTIAKRLTESKQNVPHFYLSVDCQLDNLLAARKSINDAAEAGLARDEKPAYKLSVNDMIIKAVAMGLRDVPAANASWTDSAIQQYNNVDISVAVALDGGLITPIVKNADQKGLAQISNEAKDLIARARSGKLQPSEYQGGGFSISNLGMYGIKNFNAIINPPQGCILAVGAGEERVVSKNGQFATATVMTVTLSCDHRVVDGAVGAEFLAAFKRYIETPVMMLV
jgi:pyruvate dehydrogenase E2 component (dihydrolipoamide acetyltransferase)